MNAHTPQGYEPPVFQQTQQAQQPKKKRSFGLGATAAMVVAASVITGSIVGVAVHGTGSGVTDYGDNHNASKSLEQKPADAPKSPDGSVEKVAAAVLSAVVSIRVDTNQGTAEGSGSIISDDGVVLTNNHVVDGAGGGKLTVSLNNGDQHDASVIATDPATDIAVIHIKDVKGLPTLKFGDSNQLAVGQQVVAVGAPLGLAGTVTSGIVSAKQRPVRASQGGGESSLIDGIQTDAAINPGNSGGPLVDMNGNLVGMNSMIASLSSSQGGPTGGGESGSIGLGFAIPSNFANRVAKQLIDRGKATQPQLGVKVDARNPVEGGLIVGVDQGGPGDKAGLKANDVVTRVDDRRIDTSDALIAAVRSHNFGDKVTLQVTDRNGQNQHQVEATLSGE